jgi:hypothetical protein
MSIIDPTKNTSLIIDDFIQYATQHLTTVSGVASTISLYPTVPVPTPGPGVVIWSGYTVTPSTPSPQIPPSDDSPESEGKGVDEHEKNNGKVDSDKKIEAKPAEQATTNFDYAPRSAPTPIQGEPPTDFKPEEKQPSTENLKKIESGPPAKIFAQVGAIGVSAPPDWKGKYENGTLPPDTMIGVEKGGRAEYTYKGTGGWYLLHPEAANQYFKLKAAAKSAGIGWTITSAYRSVSHQSSLGSGSTIAKAGKSPHGWGLALDFGELYRAVGGSGVPSVNKQGRETSSLYRWLSNNAPKYGWYNPYRLADGNGVDEMWHWEYWGFYTDKV